MQCRVKCLKLVFQRVQHYTVLTILRGQHSWTALAGVLKHYLSVCIIHFKVLNEIFKKVRTVTIYEKH